MKVSNTATRLIEIMNSRGIKQVDILSLAKPYCEKYGVRLGRNDISQYVNGKVEPGQEKLTILGMALDVSEAWLMGYDVPISRLDSPPSSTELNMETKVLTDEYHSLEIYIHQQLSLIQNNLLKLERQTVEKIISQMNEIIAPHLRIAELLEEEFHRLSLEDNSNHK